MASRTQVHAPNTSSASLDASLCGVTCTLVATGVHERVAFWNANRVARKAVASSSSSSALEKPGRFFALLRDRNPRARLAISVALDVTASWRLLYSLRCCHPRMMACTLMHDRSLRTEASLLSGGERAGAGAVPSRSAASVSTSPLPTSSRREIRSRHSCSCARSERGGAHPSERAERRARDENE